MPKRRVGVDEQLAERPVVGLVDRIDPLQAFVDGERTGVDLLAFGDDAGNRAEAAGDADRADVGVGRQAAGEHLRVELVGLAVDVEPGAREIRRSSGAPRSTTGRNSSSTKLSSERRMARSSRREAARKAAG